MKTVSAVTSAVFLIILFGFGAAFWMLPDQTFSLLENRSLQTLPRFSYRELRSGGFTASVEDYFADQFPLRDRLVECKGFAELSLGKGENNGILLGKNGQLARRTFDVRLADGTVLPASDGFDPAHVKAATDAIDRVAERMEIPFAVLLTGRTLDVAASAFSYPTEWSGKLTRTVRNGLSQKVAAPDLVGILRDRYEAGEAVYYRTDHHWTTLGAYYGYVEAMKALGEGEAVLPPESFEKTVISTSFFGTFRASGGMRFASPDTVEIWTTEDEADYQVVADGIPLEGFYSTRHLAGKDHYAVFLDGTHDVVTVTKRGAPKRKRLLIAKDSFANALAPFLARHFDLILCNLSSSRQDFTDLTALSAQYEADAVLLVYTLGNVITSDPLTRLS